MPRTREAEASGATPAAASRHGMVLLQSVAIVLAWCVPAFFHASNDGLWFRGDAARHAINGLFWWDFISAFPSDPVNYVVRYYARYPTISPLVYPPAFYVLEGAAFRAFGPSPFVAKWLVLCFSLLACLYLAAWLRRYVAFDAGWGGALLALQPGVVMWSNAVMLNVPSMALGVVALYYARRWIDEPSPRRLLLVFLLGVLTALTYFPAGLVTIVLCAWLAGEGRWRVVWHRHRTLLFLGFGVFALFAVVIVHWVPLPFEYVLSPKFFVAHKWDYYVLALPEVLNPSLLFLAACAFPAAMIERRWRRDVRLLTIWILIIYVGLSCLWAREPRYALLLAPAFVLLAMIGIRAALGLASCIFGAFVLRYFSATLIGMVAISAWLSTSIRVPSFDGFREMATVIVREAPTERIFYEGHSDGVFTFYVRAQDPGFQRAVVRGSKLLYASAIFPRWRLTENVSSVSDVIRALESRCGCGWVVLERQNDEDEIAAVRYLRQAVQGPEFRLVRSFPIRDPGANYVDVYQFLGRLEIPEELELPIPLLGKNTSFRARPIER